MTGSLDGIDVIILGAGAAGLMCAWQAAMRGRRVVVLDHGSRPARKVRIAGGGHCNFTNRHVSPANYLSGNPHFCTSALARYSPADMLAVLDGHSIAWEERDHGRLFCRGSAGELAGLLVRLARRHGADLRTGWAVHAVRRDGAGLAVDTGQGSLRAASVVVALGGPAWPQAGATAVGCDIARSFGLKVIDPRPALVPLRMPRDWPLAGLAGIAVGVRMACAGQEFQDQLLFTHHGLSGPAALQASLYWRPGLELEVDFLPGEPLAELLAGAGSGKARLRNLLARRLPERLADALLAELGPRGVGGLRKAEIEAAARRVHGSRFTPASVDGWAKAEVTAGGVDTAALSSKTMECRDVPGLSFVGEVLDVTGQLGGYNLHWAWASGFAAGRAC